MITSPCAAAREARRGLPTKAESEERNTLSSFDEEYEQQLAEARARATARGRGDVLDYLHLKAANDTLRARAIEWLLDSFTALAGELNRAGAGLSLARTDAHRFRVGHSTMVGERLVLRRGLRAPTVEAGWAPPPPRRARRGRGVGAAPLRPLRHRESHAR